MGLKQLRARRIAEARRQLAGLEAARPAHVDSTVPMETVECGGRGHLFGAGNWLVALNLRALFNRVSPGQPRGLRSAKPTRLDYFLALIPGGKSSRDPHK